MRIIAQWGRKGREAVGDKTSHLLNFTIWSLTWMLLGMGMPDWASAAPQAPAHQAEAMTVEARRIEERLSAELESYGHQVTVITSQQIEESGFTEIYQMLESLVPGMFVSLKSGPGDYATYNLHGSSKLLLLVDGVRINNRLYGSCYLDSIGPNMIDRIEVLYGGEGLFYGTEAASGVINIITKPVTKDLSMQFGAAYGQYGRRNFYGYASDTIDGHGFMVWAANDAWNGYQNFTEEALNRVGNSYRETRDYDRTNMGIKYQHEYQIKGRGVLRAQYQRNTNPASYAGLTRPLGLNDRTENLAILKWDHDVNRSFSYYVKTFFHDWWTKYTARNLDGSYRSYQSPWGYQDWGVNAMASYRFGGGHEVLAGLDYQNYFGDDKVLIIRGDHEQVWAFFTQYRLYLPFAPFIRPAVGLRYNKTGGNDKLVWNASARADLAGGFYARAVAGTSFILPNAQQLYCDEETYRGNPDLKPEESLNLDVGLGFKRGLFFVEAGYFYQEIKDLIARQTVPGDRDIYQNIGGESEFKGFDLMAGVGPWRGFTLRLSYSNVEATQGDSGEQMDNVPKYFYKGTLSWRHDLGSGHQLGADLAGRYVGDVQSSEIEYGKYWLADLSFFYRFGKEHRHMFSVRAENLFDEKYYSRVGTATDTNGERFAYGFEGVPFNVMAGYTFYY